MFSGDQVLVSDSEGTFDASRLAQTTDILLVAAGTGEHTIKRAGDTLFQVWAGVGNKMTHRVS